MSRPPHAREKVLDAFEAILLEDGSRSASLEAVAQRAGVSKGGLLYHFASREALEAGAIERMQELTAADIDDMAHAPEGAVHFFIRTSADVGKPLDRSVSAVGRLAHGGSSAASDALADLRERWADAIRPVVPDTAALNLILLLSDGLYVNSAVLNDVPGPVPTGADLTDLIALVERMIRPQPGA